MNDHEKIIDHRADLAVASEKEDRLDDLRRDVFGIHEDSPPEQIAEVMDKLATVERFVKDAKAKFKELLFERIEANGPVTIGDVRWYNGTKTTTKCIDPPKTLLLLVRECGGDLDRVASLMASSPFKHGAIAGVLSEDDWLECFAKTTVREAKSGKPLRETKSLDTTVVIPKGGRS